MDKQKARRLIPVTEWPKFHPWPPEGGLCHLIFHEKQNGFSRCIRRIGRRVLIDEDEFFLWADERDRASDNSA